MIAVDWRPQIRVVIAFLAIVIALAIAHIPLPLPRLIGAEARLVHGVETITPDGKAEDLPLPADWLNEEGGPFALHVRLTLPPDADREDRRYLFIPYFEQRLRAVVGETEIHDSLDIRYWSGPVGHLSALIALPDPFDDPQTVDLFIHTGELPRGTLSRVYVGPREAFLVSYRLRAMLEERIKPMLFGAQLLLAMISLAIFWLRPSDRVFGWLGATSILACVVGAGVLMPYLPAIERGLRQVYLMAPFAGLALLGFTASLVGRPVPKAALFVLPGIVLTSFILSFHPDITLTQTALLSAVPGFLIAVCWSVFILFLSLGKTTGAAAGLFLAGLLIILYGVSHDLAVRTGL